MPDIALVTTFLQLEPGVKMLGKKINDFKLIIECGTGSGSFSHSIVRTIQPSGKLFSFEYHSDRAQQATKEFSLHGFSDLVTVDCRDVCAEGFGIKNAVSAGNAEFKFT